MNQQRLEHYQKNWMRATEASPRLMNELMPNMLTMWQGSVIEQFVTERIQDERASATLNNPT